VHNQHTIYSLMDYITGHLEESQFNEVRFHLEHCSECRNHYDELSSVHHAIQHNPKTVLRSAYTSSILPRIHERLARPLHSDWMEKKITAALLLPLVVSILCVTLIARIPSEVLFGNRAEDTIAAALKDFTSEEVVQAVANENAASWASPNQEVVYEGIEEHLRSDLFFREALAQQIDTEEPEEIDIGGVLTSMNGEQADLILSGLTERETL
jgi:anti-sigma factor RsiW